jgi:hypothetical protein
MWILSPQQYQWLLKSLKLLGVTSVTDFLSCLENLVALCHVIESHTLWDMSSHTHTHCMSWVVYLNFLCPRKYLCWLYSQLSFISLRSFEMLSDCVINGLYMRVLKMTWEKLNSINFSSVFYLSVWSVRTDLFLCPNEHSLAIRCSSSSRPVG